MKPSPYLSLCDVLLAKSIANQCGFVEYTERASGRTYQGSSVSPPWTAMADLTLFANCTASSPSWVNEKVTHLEYEVSKHLKMSRNRFLFVFIELNTLLRNNPFITNGEKHDGRNGKTQGCRQRFSCLYLTK